MPPQGIQGLGLFLWWSHHSANAQHIRLQRNLTWQNLTNSPPNFKMTKIPQFILEKLCSQDFAVTLTFDLQNQSDLEIFTCLIHKNGPNPWTPKGTDSRIYNASGTLCRRCRGIKEVTNLYKNYTFQYQSLSPVWTWSFIFLSVFVMTIKIANLTSEINQQLV